MGRTLCLLTLALACLAATARASARTANCSLTVAGTSYNFDFCAPVQGANGPCQIFYSLGARPSGGALWRGGFKAQSAGWAGLGPGASEMLGAKVAIAKANSTAPTGATVVGYALPQSTSAAAVNAAAGTWALTDTAAQLVDGTLSAVFTMPLPAGVKTAAGSSLPYIWAMGRLTSADALLQHDDNGSGSLAA